MCMSNITVFQEFIYKICFNIIISTIWKILDCQISWNEQIWPKHLVLTLHCLSHLVALYNLIIDAGTKIIISLIKRFSPSEIFILKNEAPRSESFKQYKFYNIV